MSQTDTRTLQQIKRETELTRANLTSTVEQLKTSVADTASDIRHRISPDTIKAEVSHYIKSRGEQLMDDITASARRNPIQAVAVGAGVAYPLLRMVRAMPLPILMIGAGFFFAGTKRGQEVSQKASDMAYDISDDLQRRAHDLRDQAGESAAAARAFASDNLNRLRDSVAGGTEQVGQAADQVTSAANRAAGTLASSSEQLKDKAASLGSSAANKAASVGAAAADKAASLGASAVDQATDLKDRTLRAVGSAASRVQDAASDAASQARRMAGSTAEAGLNAMKTARDTASDFTDRAGKTLMETVEQNPLLVAGVGLAIGGLIASALPRTAVEEDLVDNANRSLKKAAAAVAASQGIEAVKNIVSEVYEKAARQAEAEGLTPDALGRTAQDIGQRVRRVAESAVTTAFEPQDQLQQNANGARDHG